MVARFPASAFATLLAFACGADTRPLDVETRASLTGLIYYHSTSGELTAVRRVKPDGGDDRAITDPSVNAFVYPADRASIFLVIDDDLFLARPDGSNLRGIAQSEGFDWYPRLSPDGARVLFESSRTSFRDLYLVSRQGGTPTRLTDNREGNFDAVWSPDGKQVAFSSSRYGQLDLFVANSDMTDIRRITKHPGDSVKPSWSKSGEWIAFISRRDGEEDLFVVRPNGLDITNLTREIAGDVTSFSWHPASDSIAVANKWGKKPSKLSLVEPGSTQFVTLSGSDHDDADPDWSPDGRFLVFMNKTDGRPDIWMMRADGKQRTRLTTDARGAWLPRWIGVEGR